MKISKSVFLEEFNSLINAAYSANSKETARGFLIEAKSKLDGYYNIPSALKRECLDRIDDAKLDLGL